MLSTTTQILKQRLVAHHSQAYMRTYNLQQQKRNHKGLFSKFPVLHVYIPSATTQTSSQWVVTKITSLKSVNTCYKNNKNKHKALLPHILDIMQIYPKNTINKNAKDCCKILHSNICTYPLQKSKHKQKSIIYKIPRLTLEHTPNNITKLDKTSKCQYAQSLVVAMPSLTFFHTHYNITNINTKSHFQNYKSSMCTYPLQQH